jgi:segregation and condensation protein B
VDEKDDSVETTPGPRSPADRAKAAPGEEGPSPEGGTASTSAAMDATTVLTDASGPAGELTVADEAPVLPPPQVRAVVEALVFASPQPLTAKEIGRVLGGVPKESWQRALEELRADYARDERGLQLVEVAGGWQITTRPEYHDWVRELLDPKAPTRLSIPALETLAVIAYRQPVTLPEIIDLRGVRSQGVVKTLLEKRLIRIVGRKEVVGRPMLYGTTKQFLLHFGLRDLGELPKIEEFAEVLGEELDVPGLKRAIEAPRPVEVPLAEGEDEAPSPLEESGSEPTDEGGSPTEGSRDTDAAAKEDEAGGS